MDGRQTDQSETLALSLQSSTSSCVMCKFRHRFGDRSLDEHITASDICLMRQVYRVNHRVPLIIRYHEPMSTRPILSRTSPVSPRKRGELALLSRMMVNLRTVRLTRSIVKCMHQSLLVYVYKVSEKGHVIRNGGVTGMDIHNSKRVSTSEHYFAPELLPLPLNIVERADKLSLLVRRD